MKESTRMTTELVDLTTVALKMRCGYQVARDRMLRGDVMAVRHNGRWFVDADSLAVWLAAHEGAE